MIKGILLVITFFLSTGIAAGQSVFKIIEVAWQGRGDAEPPPLKDNDGKYYSIAQSKDTQAILLYPPWESRQGPVFDTIKAIKELLAYKGDTRICGTPIGSYCIICASGYGGGKYYYSLQLQALYLIDQLVYNPTHYYSPYPVLFDKRRRREITVDEKGITRLFNAYIKWYERVKHMTMAEIRNVGDNPYQNADVYWR